MRPSGRKPDQLRSVSFERNYIKHAEGSCLVKFGDTHVLCTASLEERVPPWMKGLGKGWVTAEYGMLPRSTDDRMRREASAGKQSGRTQEIQRLVGRSLRAVVDLVALGEKQITLDCDVIQADGGTRTAAITGSWIALHDCLKKLLDRKVQKLAPYQAGGKTTILLVESEDIALMNDAVMLEAIRTAYPTHLPQGVGQLWYADTSLPSDIEFFDFTAEFT